VTIAHIEERALAGDGYEERTPGNQLPAVEVAARAAWRDRRVLSRLRRCDADDAEEGSEVGLIAETAACSAGVRVNLPEKEL
jgi:hypothetical protein